MSKRDFHATDIESPDISLLEEIEAQATSIAKDAGRILLEQFRKPLEVSFKGGKKSDPVTTADHRSEEYLKGAITGKFPRHGILSEEGGVLCQSDSPFIWVIDPLDGTTNFINGLPLFAVSIGVLWKGQPVAGAIYVPVGHHGTEGIYHTRLGNGAFFNGERITITGGSPGRPLAEIPGQFRKQFRLSTRSGREPHEARNLGSIALELAFTACGVFQYALFAGPKLWDVAAGVLLVKEANGLVFTRPAKGKGWLPLERFQTEKGGDREILENLRRWSLPLIVGNRDTAGKVARDIRVRRSPLSWLKVTGRLRSEKNGKK